MKVTFVSPPPNLSGGLRVIATYADQLRALGHDVTVVATRSEPPSFRSRLKDNLRMRASQPPSDKSHFDKMQARLHLLDHAGPVTDSDVPDADVVIATWWETAFAVAALSPAKGRKYYFVQGHEVHDDLPMHLSAGSYYLPLKKIVVSGWLAERMRENYGDNAVDIVPNSVDHTLFHAPRRTKQRNPTVGLVHSTNVMKGSEVGLKALDLVKQQYPELRVVAFGTEPIETHQVLPKNSQFFLQPEQEKIRTLYAMCDVFLSTSRSEGFGLPILEAMACRCPVVATLTGCAADFITDGVNGYLAEIDDVDALVRGVSTLLALDPQDWEAASDAALDRVSGYSWQTAAKLFEKAISQ